MKISVIIITRNRCIDLKNTIHAYLMQTYTDKEVIVVDNASNDGTREMMNLEFPEIKYFWLPENFDIRSINIGIEMSSGDIIWRTDDDSYPEQADAFEKVAAIFKNNEDIHIICSEDIEVRQNYKIWEWYPIKVDKINIPQKGYKANSFPGTGAGIRREVYDKIGGFWEFGFEELDFCTRAIVAGYNIRYFPNIRTLHFASSGNRNNAVRWVKISKQLIRYQWKYFPFWMALSQTMLYIPVQFIEAIAKRLPLSAIFEGFFGMLSVAFGAYREERQVVPTNMIDDITLGTNAFKTQIHYYKTIFGLKFNFKKSK
jgi:GT2 family glycosyltransferase